MKGIAMPRLIVRFEDVPFENRTEAEEFAAEVGASSLDLTKDRASRQSSLDLSFENHYDGNSLLEYNDNAQGYLEYEDGTIGRHYVRRERRFDD